MDSALSPTEMVEPLTGRRCLVRGNDVTEFLRRGYLRLDAVEGPSQVEGAVVGEPAELGEAVEPSEAGAPARRRMSRRMGGSR